MSAIDTIPARYRRRKRRLDKQAVSAEITPEHIDNIQQSQRPAQQLLSIDTQIIEQQFPLMKLENHEKDQDKNHYKNHETTQGYSVYTSRERGGMVNDTDETSDGQELSSGYTDSSNQNPFFTSTADNSFETNSGSLSSPTSDIMPQNTKSFSIRLDLPNKAVTMQLSSSTTVTSLLEELTEEYPYEVGVDVDEIMLWETISLSPTLKMRRPLRDNEYLTSIYDSWDLIETPSAYSIQLLSSVFRFDPSSIASLTPRRDILQVINSSRTERDVYCKRGLEAGVSWSKCRAHILSNGTLVLTNAENRREINVDQFELYECADLAAPGRHKLILRSQEIPAIVADHKDTLYFLSTDSAQDYELLRNIFFTLRFQVSQQHIQAKQALHLPKGLKNSAASTKSNETTRADVEGSRYGMMEAGVERTHSGHMIKNIPAPLTSTSNMIPPNSLLGRTFTQKKKEQLQQQQQQQQQQEQPHVERQRSQRQAGLVSTIPTTTATQLFKSNTLLGKPSPAKPQPIFSPLQACSENGKLISPTSTIQKHSFSRDR